MRRGEQHGTAAATQDDAAGAVDGVKDGKYAFHTGSEPNPWWQVDLGKVQVVSPSRGVQPARLCSRTA